MPRDPPGKGQEEGVRAGGVRLPSLSAPHADLQVQLLPPFPPGSSIRHLALQILDFQVLFLQVPLLLGYLLEELLDLAVLSLKQSLGRV